MVMLRYHACLVLYFSTALVILGPSAGSAETAGLQRTFVSGQAANTLGTLYGDEVSKGLINKNPSDISNLVVSLDEGASSIDVQFSGVGSSGGVLHYEAQDDRTVSRAASVNTGVTQLTGPQAAALLKAIAYARTHAPPVSMPDVQIVSTDMTSGLYTVDMLSPASGAAPSNVIVRLVFPQFVNPHPSPSVWIRSCALERVFQYDAVDGGIKEAPWVCREF